MNNFNLHELIFIDFLNAMNEEDLCHYIEKYNSLFDFHSSDEFKYSYEYCCSFQFEYCFFSSQLKNKSSNIYLSSIKNSYLFLKEIQNLATEEMIELAINQDPSAYCLINKNILKDSHLKLSLENLNNGRSMISCCKVLDTIDSIQQVDILNNFLISEAWYKFSNDEQDILVITLLTNNYISSHLSYNSLFSMYKIAAPSQKKQIIANKNWKSDAKLIMDKFKEL
jgi:hypothetical protein